MPLPNLKEAFSEVRREESRKKVMMGSHYLAFTLEGSALATWGYPNNNHDSWQKRERP